LDRKNTHKQKGEAPMKKYWIIACLTGLLVLLPACKQAPAESVLPESGVSESVLSESPQKTVPPEEASTVAPVEAVEFNDPVLEQKIRTAMNRPEGPITVEEAAAVTALDLGNESFEKMNDGNKFKDISALRYFTGLKELNLSFNEFSDLSSLSGLANLETLAFNGTWVEDITPLKDLTNLKCLVFCWMRGDSGTPKGIESLSALSGLKNLEMLDTKNAGIRDISALADLPKLWEVQLNDNLIEDVSPLAEVKALKTLLLAGNPVKDFSPLKDIYAQLEGKDFEIK
jgi:hypothetical protein